jgi:D-alanine-D-alanine ligase
LESDDPNLSYYYDFTQSIQEYTKVFAELGLSWTWQPVTLQNFQEVLSNIATSDTKPLVLNLCDGDEVNGAPGVSVILEMDRMGLTYTGSDEHSIESPRRRSL